MIQRIQAVICFTAIVVSALVIARRGASDPALISIGFGATGLLILALIRK